MNNDIAIHAQMNQAGSGLFNFNSFAEAANAANFLSQSNIVPTAYRAYVEKKGQYGKPTGEFDQNPNAAANCLVALNMANRMGADPLMIMQNLYIIEGRPAWSSQFIIAAINSCGRFSALRFDIQSLGEKSVEYQVTEWENRQKKTVNKTEVIDNLSCVAWAIEKSTGERIESSVITMELAVKEGWYGKNGSKWQTMPEQMLRYRAAAFFGRIYAPELLMGIQTKEEVDDISELTDVTPSQNQAPTSINDSVNAALQSLPSETSPAIEYFNPNELLESIGKITDIQQVRPVGEEIAKLVKDAAINIKSEDVDKLRKALSDKKSRLVFDGLMSSIESCQNLDDVDRLGVVIEDKKEELPESKIKSLQEALSRVSEEIGAQG